MNKNPSGWNEDKIHEEAVKLYKEKSGHRTFKFDECYKIIQVLPKFDPMRSPPDRSATPTTNCDGKVMGEDMERPIGTKKAKIMKKLEYEDSSAADYFATFQNSMVEVNNRLVDVLERKQRHDVWIKQAQFYQAMGNMPMALEYMKKIEMDENSSSKNNEVHIERLSNLGDDEDSLL